MLDEKHAEMPLDIADELETAIPISLEQEEKALAYLKNGMDKQKIARRLIEDGMSRPAAIELTIKVWEQGANTRRTNALILIVVAGLMLIIGIIDLLPRLMSAEPLPLFILAYALLPLGMIMIVQGIFQYRHSGSKPNIK